MSGPGLIAMCSRRFWEVMPRTAMNTQHRLMYGLSLSPILAAFQTMPIVLSSHTDISIELRRNMGMNAVSYPSL